MMNLSEIKKMIQKQPVHGRILYESGRVTEREPSVSRRFIVHSVAKSVTAIAVGFALEEGLLDLDETLEDAFPEKLTEAASLVECSFGRDAADRQKEEFGQVCVRHLLSHTSGFRENYLTGFQRPYLEDDDWLKLCLSNRITQTPGESFLYCDANYYLIAKLLRRRTGIRLTEYLLPRLFKPLGIRYPAWEPDPDGDMIGCGGLILNMDELHRLGLVCLNGGSYNGSEVIPEAWLDTAMHEKISIGDGRGYGYGFWTTPEYCYMFGYGGVYNFISRETDTLYTVDGLILER